MSMNKAEIKYVLLSMFLSGLVFSPPLCVNAVNLDISVNTIKEYHKLAFRSMIEYHFEKKNIIRCKKLATTVSSRKNVTRPFIRRKQQVSSSAEFLTAIFNHISDAFDTDWF